jgi:hypothetical protein
MGGSARRGPESLAARAVALQRAAETMALPELPPVIGPLDDLMHAAAVDEIRRAKANMLKRAKKLWAESGKRYMASVQPNAEILERRREP